VANYDGSQYNIYFLQSISNNFCFVFWQRIGSSEIFISCWLNRFVSEVLFCRICRSSEECSFVSDEEPSSHSVLKLPVRSLEVLEFVNCHHDGLALLQSLGMWRPTQCYAYSLLRNLWHWHNGSSIFFVGIPLCLRNERQQESNLFQWNTTIFIEITGYWFRSLDHHQVIHMYIKFTTSRRSLLKFVRTASIITVCRLMQHI